MAAGTQSETIDAETEQSEPPEISICETAPGKTVFIETDNNDGWVASDTTVDVER